MKKSNYVTLVLGTIGGVVTSIGMCMCLITEWNAFRPGLVVSAIGAVILLCTVLVWRKMEHKAPIKISGKLIASIFLGVAGALLLGVGLCSVMLWSKVVVGIGVGCVGIVLLLSLVPLVKGVY